MTQFQDAFISYGRADSKQFAKKLSDRLVAKRLEVWLDFDAIPLGVDYQKQIDEGIVKADNFIFIISPHAVHSAYCAVEIDLALKHHKRIIPLLHVEQIKREVWQQRHPQGSDADWQTYTQKELHSSFANMHPEISKINWVYFREETDDFDQAFQGLLEIMRRHQDYVRQHTIWLDQALMWQRQQNQVECLLSAENLPVATDWLQVRFPSEQPPCLPTDLHCELITESLKYFSDGMTQVFLSYGEEDRAIAEQVRKTLIRAGITVWIDKNDIKTAEDFQKAIYRGIEKADNIVYLLSPASLRSTYCQQELAYARTYHKRIIPLLARETDLSQVPPDLQTLQFIDFTQYQDKAALSTASDKLLRSLQEEAPYYAQHKRLLLKALAWDRQNHAKTLVLRGREFAIAEEWLVQSQDESKQPPTDLHRAYLLASQEMNQYFDAFISYGRVDSKAFAIELHARLTAMGWRIWLDQNDIPLGVDYQDQIDEGLSKAHNFLFILSPHAVNSPYCAREVSLALKHNKRIVPLLHVEQISRATWQQRYPSGTEQAWASYQTKGLDSIFPNMAAEIGKINWVYFRAEDDFEGALASLVAVFERHQDYVYQHTDLLTKASAWERHQHQSQYLLVGEERKAAEAWLTQRWRGEQPPCLPTDLHCEFIAASLKYAENFMSQVFLAHAEEMPQTAQSPYSDRPKQLQASDSAGQKIYRSLIRSGFTVWNRRLDVASGENLQEAIFRGIAEADNFVFLLSTVALKSDACQQQLDYATALNKRIIPVLAQQLTAANLPATLADLQVIDLTDNQNESDYLEDENQLLKTLQQEADYHYKHKLLLVQAQKWQQQKQNPSILLRGQALQQNTAWLKLAKGRDRYQATALQTEFIEASRQQPPDITIDVFIAYSLVDADFVRRLNDTLQVQGKSTYVDQTGEADIRDRQGQQQAIENAENFLFVLSPSSVKSPPCLEQLRYAQRLNKRIIAIAYRSVLQTNLPSELELVAQVDFQQQDRDFLTSFGELYRTLESDPQHVKTHTRLLVKAKEWEQSEQDDSFLLRGKDLAAAAAWLEQATTKVPQPTDSQRAYLQASQALPFRKIKGRSVAFSSAAAVVFVLLARFFSLLQGAELAAYDHLLRQRPSEPQDDRFLIVEVDEKSGSWLRSRLIEGTYEPGIGTLPDQALEQTLAKLSAYEPQLIGLDFYRDFPADPVVANRLRQTPNLVGLCKLSTETEAGVPQADIPAQQTGFNDFVDNVSVQFIRRQLIMHPADPDFCPTNAAFSLLLARQYLATKNIPVTFAQIDNPDGTYRYEPIQVGSVTVPQLRFGAGPYYLDPVQLNGYQTLLNFRTHEGTLNEFAPKITLERLLTETSESTLNAIIRDRIVIIGYTDKTDRNTDTWDTPYSEDVPGAIMQAQMTSQLISAALNERSLMRWWPLWAEVLWTAGWSALGGVTFWRLVHPWRLGLASLGGLAVLYGVCYGLLVGGAIWVGLVPPAIAFGLTGLSVALLNTRLRQI